MREEEGRKEKNQDSGSMFCSVPTFVSFLSHSSFIPFLCYFSSLFLTFSYVSFPSLSFPLLHLSPPLPLSIHCWHSHKSHQRGKVCSFISGLLLLLSLFLSQLHSSLFLCLHLNLSVLGFVFLASEEIVFRNQSQIINHVQEVQVLLLSLSLVLPSPLFRPSFSSSLLGFSFLSLVFFSSKRKEEEKTSPE